MGGLAGAATEKGSLRSSGAGASILFVTDSHQLGNCVDAQGWHSEASLVGTRSNQRPRGLVAFGGN